MNISLLFADTEFRLKLREKEENRIQVDLNGETFDIRVEYFSPEEYLLNINGKVYDVIVSPNSSSYAVCINGKNIHVGKKSPLQLLGGRSVRSGRREVKTSMPGRIIEILVQEGEEVEEGQAVLILEAMKMQNEIKSPQPGKIACIGPKTGESVESGALLFVIS
ncbi:MAG: biotin/lipoyl-containing protein [Candidatus Aminicenantaceae bacterium]